MYLCSLLQNITLKMWNNVIEKIGEQEVKQKEKKKKKNPLEVYRNWPPFFNGFVILIYYW